MGIKRIIKNAERANKLSGALQNLFQAFMQRQRRKLRIKRERCQVVITLNQIMSDDIDDAVNVIRSYQNNL